MKRLAVFILFCASAIAQTPRSVTVKESGGTYPSISAAEDGEDGTGDLVSRNEVMTFSIEGSWSAADTTGTSFFGWTTDATRYIVIQTVGSSRHDGKRYGSAANAYRLETTGADCLQINENYVRIYGLQLKHTVNSATGRICIVVNSVDAGGSDIRIGNCIFTSSTSSTGNSIGIYASDADATVTVFNSLFHSITSGAAIGVFVSASTVNVHNCTVFGVDTGFSRSSGTGNTYNCISQDNATDGWTGTWGGNYNRSDRAADSPGANSINDTDDVLFVSTSAGSEDFHLSSSEVTNPNATSVINYTSDQSSGLFADDMDYVTRTGSWDIGADEYVAPATSGGQVIIVISN